MELITPTTLRLTYKNTVDATATDHLITMLLPIYGNEVLDIRSSCEPNREFSKRLNSAIDKYIDAVSCLCSYDECDGVKKWRDNDNWVGGSFSYADLMGAGETPYHRLKTILDSLQLDNKTLDANHINDMCFESIKKTRYQLMCDFGGVDTKLHFVVVFCTKNWVANRQLICDIDVAKEATTDKMYAIVPTIHEHNTSATYCYDFKFLGLFQPGPVEGGTSSFGMDEEVTQAAECWFHDMLENSALKIYNGFEVVRGLELNEKTWNDIEKQNQFRKKLGIADGGSSPTLRYSGLLRRSHIMACEGPYGNPLGAMIVDQGASTICMSVLNAETTSNQNFNLDISNIVAVK